MSTTPTSLATTVVAAPTTIDDLKKLITLTAGTQIFYGCMSSYDGSLEHKVLKLKGSKWNRLLVLLSVDETDDKLIGDLLILRARLDTNPEFSKLLAQTYQKIEEGKTKDPTHDYLPVLVFPDPRKYKVFLSYKVKKIDMEGEFYSTDLSDGIEVDLKSLIDPRWHSSSGPLSAKDLQELKFRCKEMLVLKSQELSVNTGRSVAFFDALLDLPEGFVLDDEGNASKVNVAPEDETKHELPPLAVPCSLAAPLPSAALKSLLPEDEFSSTPFAPLFGRSYTRG